MRKAIARLFLRLQGWRAEGERPEPRKFVLIAAPHTSNWDLFFLLAFAAVFDIEISWLGKRQIFVGPFGPLARALGGIPVIRERRTNMVDAMASTFEGRDDLALVVPAEGTRKYQPYWKSGFYYIAKTAGVPIIPSYLDFSRKVGGFGPSLVPSGDVKRDMDILRAFYADKKGKHPEDFSTVLLKEES